MNITEIKKKMLEYSDLFGQQLINHSDINKCKTKEELFQLIEFHNDFLESSCNDAQNSLFRFKQTLI